MKSGIVIVTLLGLSVWGWAAAPRAAKSQPENSAAALAAGSASSIQDNSLWKSLDRSSGTHLLPSIDFIPGGGGTSPSGARGSNARAAQAKLEQSSGVVWHNRLQPDHPIQPRAPITGDFWQTFRMDDDSLMITLADPSREILAALADMQSNLEQLGAQTTDLESRMNSQADLKVKSPNADQAAKSAVNRTQTWTPASGSHGTSAASQSARRADATAKPSTTVQTGSNSNGAQFSGHASSSGSTSASSGHSGGLRPGSGNHGNGFASGRSGRRP